MRKAIVAFLILVSMNAVEAQTTKRIYIVSIITDCNIRPGVRRAKYFCDSLHTIEQGIVSRWQEFGKEPYMLVWADVTQEQHDSLAIKSDVATFPANLDANLTVGAVTQISNALENRNLPGDWVNTSLTYRQVIKRILAFAQFLQRFGHIRRARFFDGSVNLATEFRNLPLAVRSSMIAAAQDLSFDTSGLTATSTLRQIVAEMIRQWILKPDFIDTPNGTVPGSGSIFIGGERF